MEGSQNVLKLEGSRNWNVWKFQTTVLFRGQGWLDIVEGRCKKPKDAVEKAVWESKDAKAQTLIVTRMTEDVMLHIISCTTSAEMWKKLQTVYEQKTDTSIHIVQQRFFQYKYEKDIEMSVFLSKIQEMQNQLKQMGEEISDKFVITKILMSIPEDYKHFISAWESAPDDKQTLDNLVARLLMEEERLREKNEESEHTSSLSALMAKGRKAVKCFKCGKIGHFQNECKSFMKNREDNVNNKCFYCGKSGHVQAQCWFKKNKDAHKNKDTKHNSNEETNVFIVSNTDYGDYQASNWLVDSGADQHMCCDRALFTHFMKTSQKTVIVGNGTAISVLGCGQMSVQVHNGKEWIDTVIDNVLFVPDLKMNLFSVSRVTEKGYVMMTDAKSCKFYKNRFVCAVANRVGSGYFMNLRFKCNVANFAKTEAKLKHINKINEKLVSVDKHLEKQQLPQGTVMKEEYSELEKTAGIESATDENLDHEIESESDFEPCTNNLSLSNEDNILPCHSKRPRRVRKQTSFFKCNHVRLTSDSVPVINKVAMSKSDVTKWTKTRLKSGL